MKFPYEEMVALDPILGGALLVQRPQVKIAIHGPLGRYECVALVDTGADYTVLPNTIASRIGVETQSTSGTDV